MSAKKRKIEDTNGSKSDGDGKKELAVANDHQLALPKALTDWMGKCPDTDLFRKTIENHMWLETKQKCYECGERMPRRELRADTISAYGVGHLICKSCWDFFQKKTVTSTGMDWPKEAPTKDQKSRCALVDGVLVDKSSKTRLGVVEGFNPVTRFAQRVTLDAYPDFGEPGPIDPDCDVTPTKSIMISTQHDSESDGDDDDDDD